MRSVIKRTISDHRDSVLEVPAGSTPLSAAREPGLIAIWWLKDLTMDAKESWQVFLRAEGEALDEAEIHDKVLPVDRGLHLFLRRVG